MSMRRNQVEGQLLDVVALHRVSAVVEEEFD